MLVTHTLVHAEPSNRPARVPAPPSAHREPGQVPPPQVVNMHAPAGGSSAHACRLMPWTREGWEGLTASRAMAAPCLDGPFEKWSPAVFRALRRLICFLFPVSCVKY